MEGVIGFELAALRSGMWAALWLLLTSWAVAGAKRRPGALRDAALIVVAGLVAALFLEIPQLVNYDTTVDFARATSCAWGICPGLGVYANYEALEGGVVWIWLLAQLMALDDSPRWMGSIFLLLNSLAAAILGLFAPDRRAALFAGAVYLLVVSALAAIHIQWHPTYAPLALLPFVLLAIRPTDSKHPDRDHLALGAAFGVALGVYIASLLLFVLMIPVLLRANARQRVLVGVGLVAEQLLVQPFAARHNFEQFDSNILLIGAVFGLLLVGSRKWVLPWVGEKPWLFGLAAFFATLAFGAVLADITVQPYYVSLAAPLLAGAIYDLWRRHRLVSEALLAVAAVTVVVWGSAHYDRLGTPFHEGEYSYQDLYDLAPHHRGGYGAAVTAPSMLIPYSIPLYARKAESPNALRSSRPWSDSRSGTGSRLTSEPFRLQDPTGQELFRLQDPTGQELDGSESDVSESDDPLLDDDAAAERESARQGFDRHRFDGEKPLGVGYALRGEADHLVCDHVIWSQSGELGFCEYETWIRSRGAVICAGTDANRPCHTFGSPEAYERSMIRNPFSYWPLENPEVIHFTVEVCPEARHGPRTLRPLVFAQVPVRRAVRFETAPPGGTLSEDRSEVTLEATEAGCVPLEFSWDATTGFIEPWGSEPLGGAELDTVSFMVEERRPTSKATQPSAASSR